MDAIALVGSGSVAQALGRALAARGAPVAALAARRRDRAARAAAFVGPGVRPVEYVELAGLASHLIVAVSDDAIDGVAADLAAAGWRGGVALHTCGARGPDALRALADVGASCGVFHPLQTLPPPGQGTSRLDGVAFGIGGDEAAVAWAEALVHRLNGRALHVDAGGFPAYHAAAALAANGVAALVDAALALMEQAGLARREALEAIAPLCRTSVENVLAVGPEAALTGPVARGDASTVAGHIRALSRQPDDVVGLYVAASRRLVSVARRRGLDEAAARRLEDALAAAERAGQPAPQYGGREGA